MKKDDLLDAVGMIDEKYIVEAETYEKPVAASERNRRKKKIWISLASAACLCLLIGSAWAIREGLGITGMDGAKDMAAVESGSAEETSQADNEMAQESDAASDTEAVQEESDAAPDTETVQGEADADKQQNVTNRQKQEESSETSQETREEGELFEGQETTEDETVSEGQETTGDETVSGDKEIEKTPGFWERIRTFFKGLFRGNARTDNGE